MELASILNALPGSPFITFDQIIRFTRFFHVLRPFIEAQENNITTAPETLAPSASFLLAQLLQQQPNVISTLWALLKDSLWNMECPGDAMNMKDVCYINNLAYSLETSYRHLYPPTRVCTNKACSKYCSNNCIKTLKDPSTYPAVLFTLHEGALPIFVTSWKCTACYRRYYPNYYVDGTKDSRVYYPGVPRFIQASQKIFFDTPLLEYFSTSKVFGWLSSMNCARIYNESLLYHDLYITNNPLAFPNTFHLHQPPESPSKCKLEMDEEQVLNAFFLYALILEKAEKQTVLVLPHSEHSQRDRLKPLLQERNLEMEGTGQEAYTHACDLCFKVYTNNEGQLVKLQCAVCDGNNMGHPCCAVHNCKEPLPTNRHRFCAKHDLLNNQCAVTDCIQPLEMGFRTCQDPAHRALEQAYFRRGQAIFQLRSRLERAGVHIPNDAAPTLPVETESIDDEVLVQCNQKSSAGNRKLKAYFGRRRTHNEQLIMRPCGIILSRATFYGSEAISSVNDFMKATFPTPESTPEMFAFDNNCGLDAHQKKQGNTHFCNTAKPVDVFHFRTKHKESDTHCQRYCNPAAFPEMIQDGKWVFNTSICEQTNVWIAGFHAILRDMEAVRYNFYLDEMIKRRNRYLIKQLQKKGKNPWQYPLSAVLPQNVY